MNRRHYASSHQFIVASVVAFQIQAAGKRCEGTELTHLAQATVCHKKGRAFGAFSYWLTMRGIWNYA